MRSATNRQDFGLDFVNDMEEGRSDISHDSKTKKPIEDALPGAIPELDAEEPAASRKQTGVQSWLSKQLAAARPAKPAFHGYDD